MSLQFPSRSFAIALLVVLSATPRARGQASTLPSAAPVSGTAGQSPEQRGRVLLDQMIAALGGRAWLDRTTITIDGRGAAFFRGQPNPGVSEYHEMHRLPASGAPEGDRIGFLTDKSMFFPGKKVDVVQVWVDGHGTEITYKGAAPLPKDQVADYFRRSAHSIESVVRTWIHAPGVVILSEGSSMVERRLADKISILSADNDAVTIELDAATHLPLRRSFEWRNEQFKDHDEDAEEYDDYHPVQGLPTAMNITRYHNGDMVSQRYIGKITYNQPLAPALFDPTILLVKKK